MYVRAELAQSAEWPSNKEAWASALHYFPFRIESACRTDLRGRVVKLGYPKLNGGLRNLRGRGEKLAEEGPSPLEIPPFLFPPPRPSFYSPAG